MYSIKTSIIDKVEHHSTKVHTTMGKLFSFAALLSFMILAEATPARRDLFPSQCSAQLLCCNAVQNAGDPAVSTLLALLGRSDVGPTVKCGLQCTPLSVIGVGGGSWYVCDMTQLLIDSSSIYITVVRSRRAVMTSA